MADVPYHLHTPRCKIVLPEPPTDLYRRVKARLGPDPAGGWGEYDFDTFVYNVESIHEDVKARLIPKPTTKQAWEDAIVQEFQANLLAFKQLRR